MVEYILELSEDCTDVTITLLDVLDWTVVEVTKLTDDSLVSHLATPVDDTIVITLESTEDNVYKIELLDDADVPQFAYVLNNCRAIKCGNSLNKCDVESIVCGIDKRESELVDSLNRVVIANFRLENYDEAVEGLVHIANLCVNCNCNCSC